MKIISPQVHAALDFITVIFFFVAPSIIPLSDIAGTYCYLLGGIHLLLTLATNNTGGIMRVIPFRIHGLIELFVAFFLGIMAATYFRSSFNDHLFFAIVAVVIVVVFLLTDFIRKP
ncbi:MAG: hypothetical protein REI78_05445 [Pedobacter sp.]|nr:hypothetical protein [Pedobacter sp.]MDQ8052445.1 hypothetical protein [Pedobacter sp.]